MHCSALGPHIQLPLWKLPEMERTGKMDQLLMCLPHRHKNLSLVSRNPH